MGNKRVLVIGAGGQMTSRTVRAVAAVQPAVQFVLTDISVDAANRTAAAISSSGCEVAKLDVYDPTALRSAMAGMDFVIHGAGPFYRTAGLVRSACIEAGVDYMDIDDDTESCLDAIALDAAAKAADVALYVGCGASPGLTNVMARVAMQALDEVHDVEVAWCTGDEADQQLGRAVLEHAMLIGAGDCHTWRNGRMAVHRSFEESVLFPMGPDLGLTRLYECAHPETVAISHSYPKLANVTCWGGMYPPQMSGILKGVARAESDDRISMDEACGFFRDINEGARGSTKIWRFALAGLWNQLRQREVSISATLKFIRGVYRDQAQAPAMGVAARAFGVLDGAPTSVLLTSKDHDRGSALESMESATGLSQAAFFQLAGELGHERQPGVRFPESWADPEAFLQLLCGLGVRSDAQLLCPPRIQVTQ